MDAARLELIEAGGRTIQAFGLNRLLGQIFTLLYLHPAPLSLDEIADALSVSKASVSISCRQLAGWGALRQVWLRGDRKDYYAAEADIKTLLNNGILESFRKKLDSAERQLDRTRQTIADHGDSIEYREYLIEKIQEADKIRSRIRRLIDNPLVRRMV